MIYVLVSHGFEEIEAITTLDILRRAELDVQLVGVGSRVVTGAHGLTVQADLLDEEVEPGQVEMIVLPGGMPGTLHLEKSEFVQTIIDFCACNGRWIAAICAAPSILGHKGLLEGKQATCYPGFEDQLLGAQLSENPVVVDGKYITAKGPGVSVEFALTLVSCLCGEPKANAVRGALQCPRS